MNQKSKLVLPGVITAILLLSGCTAASAPTSSAPSTTQPTQSTPSSTPTPTEEPVTSVITIGADSISISTDDSENADDFLYASTPNAAIEAITEVVGSQPTSEYSGDQKCWYQMTTVSWGDFHITYSQQDPNTAPNFHVYTKTSSPTANVFVESPNGARTGNSYADFFAKVSDHPTQTWDYEGVKYESVIDTATTDPEVSDGSENTSGVLVSSENNVITSISAPDYLYGDC